MVLLFCLNLFCSTMSQDLSQSGSKKRKTLPSKAAPRIPKGFSFRRNQPKSGQKPMCRGCTFVIDYDDKCIRYRHKPWNSSKWDEIHQYHCTEKCIKRMPEAHFEEFKKKKWVDKPVKEVLGNLSQ